LFVEVHGPKCGRGKSIHGVTVTVISVSSDKCETTQTSVMPGCPATHPADHHYRSHWTPKAELLE